MDDLYLKTPKRCYYDVNDSCQRFMLAGRWDGSFEEFPLAYGSTAMEAKLRGLEHRRFMAKYGPESTGAPERARVSGLYYLENGAWWPFQ